MWNSFTTALSFLTIIRLPGTPSRMMSPAELAAGFSFFPLVGLILGLCCLAPAWILAPRVPPFLLASLLTAFLAVLTRALHLDGLADLADGVGGGYNSARRLEIMKDSRTGAFGALALILVVLIKVAAIERILSSHSWEGLLVAPVLGRFAIALTAYKSSYARGEGGLGKAFVEAMTSRHLMAAAFFAVSICVILTPRFALYYLCATAASVAVLRRLALRTLGGVTGDVLGAVDEVTEALLLSIAASLG
jgi:adenosylcobinamide-GDP ribazoletransferase